MELVYASQPARSKCAVVLCSQPTDPSADLRNVKRGAGYWERDLSGVVLSLCPEDRHLGGVQGAPRAQPSGTDPGHANPG